MRRSEDNLWEFVFSFLTWALAIELRSSAQAVPLGFFLSSRVMKNSQNGSHKCETFTHFKSPPQKPQRQNRRGSSFLFSYHTEVLRSQRRHLIGKVI